MKLKQLLQGLEGLVIRGSKEGEISGLSADSRVIAPKNLFIAKNSEYIRQAIDSGAEAIVTDVYDPFISVPQVICKDFRKVEALLAAKYYGRPSEKLFVVGITGTKGKTTVSYLVRHLLEGLFSGEKCGLLGTVEGIIGEKRWNSALTTHGAIFNQKMLKEMVLQGCKSAVLEVSSHGLDQGRVDEIAFDVGIFTGLHSDHLDYHKTIEKYAEAKKKLFIKSPSIVNRDSPWASFMQNPKKNSSFGIDQVQGLVLSEAGAEFSMEGVLFTSPLMGLFNVYNVLAAIALGVFLGKRLEEMVPVLACFPGVPGRLERVPNKRGVHVFVDYAHTGESLEEVLSTLKKIAKKRLIVVFGCGGERDAGRRKAMAKASEKYADLSIVTTDNPRSEDPDLICRHILEGFCSLKNVMVVMDRKDAITLAIQEAKQGDFVLIAGKGHEKIQIFSNKTVSFDDVLVASEA